MRTFECDENRRNQIKQDLLDQIERNKTDGSYFADQVDLYVSLWEVKEELTADIESRGAKVTKKDSRGQEQIVNNESIEHLLKVSTQMLKILDGIGIHPVDATADGGEGDDM